MTEGGTNSENGLYALVRRPLTDLVKGGPDERPDPELIWQWFIEELKAWRESDREDLDADRLAQLSLRLLHARLRRSRSAYPVALEMARRSCLGGAARWLWQPLYENSDIRAGMTTVYQEQPLPTHAYPDADQLVLVVYGRARVMQYQVDHNPDGDTGPTLTAAGEHFVDSGNVFILRGEDKGALEIESAAPQTVLLTILTPPVSEAVKVEYDALNAQVIEDSMARASRPGATITPIRNEEVVEKD